MKQKIISGYNVCRNLGEILNEFAGRKIMLVCDSAFKYLNLKEVIDRLPNIIITFDGFKPNPDYYDVCKGVEIFRGCGCDSVIALGGGSAIDVAKCIKLFSVLSPQKNYLEQNFVESNVPLMAIPTTAGTGSESTKFAVVYFNEKKFSVESASILPDIVILDHSLLNTLPLYQKKCTLLDALCHGIESWWSVNSTDESIEYSRLAVTEIMRCKDGYFNGISAAAERILLAANYAGRAINITKTTAAHAMSYKLTSLCAIPHGHAVAVCIPQLWKFMYRNTGKCVDGRGADYLTGIFKDIANALGEDSVENGIEKFEKILESLLITAPSVSKNDLQVLASSVNAQRLQNNPVKLSEEDLLNLYKKILKEI